jgi:hypothetical protein
MTTPARALIEPNELSFRMNLSSTRCGISSGKTAAYQ